MTEPKLTVKIYLSSAGRNLSTETRISYIRPFRGSGISTYPWDGISVSYGVWSYTRGYSAGAYVRVLDKGKEADERYVYVPWGGVPWGGKSVGWDWVATL